MREDNKWKHSGIVISGDKDNRTFLVNTPNGVKCRNRVHLKSSVFQSNLAPDANSAHPTSAAEPCSESIPTTAAEPPSELSGAGYVNPNVTKMTCMTTRSSAGVKVPKPIRYRDT